jgi:hypothetical protein
MALIRNTEGNYLEFNGHRMSLDAQTEHALMGAFKHGEHRAFTDAAGVQWEINPDGEGKFDIIRANGPVIFTLAGGTLVALIEDLRAIIMGA